MRTLHRNKGKGLFLKNKFFTLDCETQGLRGQPEYFIFCCLYNHESSKFFYSVDEIKNELLKAKYKKKIIFAHNAEFDLNCIYGNIITELDNSAIYSGSTFISATNGNCIFADSLNIYKTSVKEIGKSIGLEKLETSEEFIEGTHKEITQKDLNYCERDCEIVYTALEKIFTFAGSVKKTLASLALALFKNKYLKFDIDFEETYTNEYYKSYYGGRTEAFCLRKTRAVYYDVISMYPYSMLNNFPNPKNFKTEINISKNRFLFLLKYYEGLAYVKVNHKDTYFGHLPYKDNGKLIFPVGTFSGWWNLNELRFAYEEGVIDFIEIYEISYSPEKMESPFIDYVLNLIEIKESSEGIDRVNAKLFLNALYGKFAEKEKPSSTYYDEIPLNLIDEYEMLGLEYSVKLFNHERTDCFIELKDEKKFSDKSHVIPLFASYITSYARIKLLKQAKEWQQYTPIYFDTDSIMLEQVPQVIKYEGVGFNVLKDYESDNKLGSFKKEKEIITEIKGLKNYTYIKDESGKEYKKLKGVPLSKAKEIEPNVYIYENLVKCKTSLRGKRLIKAGMQKEFRKEISNIYDKRIIIDIFGNTKPIKLNR